MRKTFVFLILALPLISSKQKTSANNAGAVMQIPNSFMSVYELSPTTTAITVNILESETLNHFDSIITHIKPAIQTETLPNLSEDSYYFDTSGKYKLFKNGKLEAEIKKHIDKAYYIYGTKGVAKYEIKNIVIGFDECKTNILAFTIEHFDTAKYGHPVFCSNQLLKINYTVASQEIENAIKIFQKNESKDYVDSIQPIVFATLDSLYFTYTDNFTWGRLPENNECKFPGRTIYILQQNGTLIKYWSDSLDLFGIPCD